MITSSGPGNSVDIINLKTGQRARVQPVSNSSRNRNGNATEYLKRELDESQEDVKKLQASLARVLATT